MKAGFGTAGPGGSKEEFIPLSAEAVGRLFPQFEMVELIGKGGMGAVYKARQPTLDRWIALKLLSPRTSNDPGFAERFAREARMLARLSHPHIVAVHDFGEVQGVPYLVMEHVDGANLRQLQQAGKLSPAEALRIVPQICEALQFAHDEGVVHRDIKPENVLLNRRGQVKIADFGLAKILGLEPGHFQLTGARDVMGTPHYMAPEQVENPQEVDHRADIYSLGVVFYELLTGELPLGRFAPPSRKVQVDVRLDEVVLRTLEKEPERRYQHASEVKSDVERISDAPPAATKVCAPTSPPARRRRWDWLALVVSVVVLLAAMNLVRRSNSRVAPTGASQSWNAFDQQKPISSDVLPVAEGGWAIDCSSPQTFRLFEVAEPGINPGPPRDADPGPATRPQAPTCIIHYQARLKTENLVGRAYLEMWVHLPGQGESFSRGLHNAAVGSNDWATYETPFILKAGETPDRLRLNLVIEGKGKVYIKEVTVTAKNIAKP